MHFTSSFGHYIIIFNKISVSIHLKAATGRSSRKQLFYISIKPMKICLWKRSILVELLHWYFSSIWTIQPVWHQHRYFEEHPFSKAALWRCSVKRCPSNFRTIHKKTNVSEPLFKSTCSSQPPTLFKKRLWLQVFSCDVGEILNKIFFTEHFRTSASVFLQSTFFKDCF